MSFINKLRNFFRIGKPAPKTPAERVEVAVRQVGEHVKDVGKNVRDALKR
jgi:hypothetical protein